MGVFVVQKEWKTKYPNPLQLKKGEYVTITQEETGHENWKNWVFCKTKINSGWVPLQVINRISTDQGIINEDYSAIELNVNTGEKVEGKKELNGWVWVRNTIGKEGWLPLEVLQKL